MMLLVGAGVPFGCIVTADDGITTGVSSSSVFKESKKDNRHAREGWEDGTPPPHRDFKERGVMSVYK
jgi:hypothetical protein